MRQIRRHVIKGGEAMKRVTATTSKMEGLERRLYTLTDLLHLTGLTRRQATYWAQTGLLVPTLRKPEAVRGQPGLCSFLREGQSRLFLWPVLPITF